MHKKEAKKKLTDTKLKLKERATEKEELEKNVNIDVCKKNGEIKALKSELQ
jgi:hypothetical protein